MNIILLSIAIIILLLLICKRENFKSVSSDFIENTGQTQYETSKLESLVQKFEEQTKSIPQTKKEIPGTKGYTTSIGWEPLFIPEGKTKNEVLDNLANIDKKSFLKVLGWEPFYEPSDAEVDIIKQQLVRLFPNIVKFDEDVLIHKLVKHEENFFSLIFYLDDKEHNMYYARVDGLIQVQNGNTIVHKLNFEGLITPFTAMSVKSAHNDTSIRKNYDERERREQKFLTKEEIKLILIEFEKRKDNIMLRLNAHQAGADPALFV